MQGRDLFIRYILFFADDTYNFKLNNPKTKYKMLQDAGNGFASPN